MIRYPTICLLLTATCWPTVVDAQVKRCATPEGISVYTDRRCEDIGAVERLPRERIAAEVSRPYRGGCARTLQDLVFEMTSAIDSNDVNRLAGVVHWVGVSTRNGYSLMGRLNAIVNRPLVDIAPVSPRAPGEMEGDADGDYYPQTTVRKAPVALRVEQTLANGSTPSRTVFGLQRHVGCWWIRM
ncbi:MAG: hypothetical protein WKF61_12540 [Luteimonas sp.]